MADKSFNTEWEQEIGLYVDNELPESSRERVERHLKRSEASACYYRILQREEQHMAGRLRHKIQPFLKSDQFVDSVMDSLPAHPTHPLWHKVKSWSEAAFVFFRTPGYSRVALAVSILVCVAGILASRYLSTPEEPRFLNLKKNGRIISITLPEYILVDRQSAGEFYEFPDTSFAYAEPGTLFSVENFQEGGGVANVGTDRRLTLSYGEMYIDVHPEQEGFTVECVNAKVTVFGTQFYVSSKDGKTIIAVREGKVMVEKHGRNQNGNTLISNNQMTEVISNNGNVIMRHPKKITSLLKERLDLFNEAYLKRSQTKGMPFDPFHPEKELPTDVEELHELYNERFNSGN